MNELDHEYQNVTEDSADLEGNATIVKIHLKPISNSKGLTPIYLRMSCGAGNQLYEINSSHLWFLSQKRWEEYPQHLIKISGALWCNVLYINTIITFSISFLSIPFRIAKVLNFRSEHQRISGPLIIKFFNELLQKQSLFHCNAEGHQGILMLCRGPTNFDLSQKET